MAMQPLLVEMRSREAEKTVCWGPIFSTLALLSSADDCFDVARSTLAVDFRITPLVENAPYSGIWMDSSARVFDGPRSQLLHNSRATGIKSL